MLAPSPLSPCQATASHPSVSIPPVLSTIPSSSSRPGATLTSQVAASSFCAFTCSLPSTRRPTRPRKNHLRTKQLSRNVSPEFLAPSLPLPRDPMLRDELAGREPDEISSDTIQLVPLVVGEDSGILTIEENERGDGPVSLMEPALLLGTEVGGASYPGTAASTDEILTPKLMIQLFLYLAALFVVQTVCAVLFLGREGFDIKDEAATERSGRKSKTGLHTWWGGVEKKQEKHSEGQVETTASELASKVAEIRAMAKEARVTEANKTVEDSEGAVGLTGDVKQEVYRRLKRMTKGTFPVVCIKSSFEDKTRKPSFKRRSEIDRHRSALNRKTPKGFNGTRKKVPRGVTTDTEVDRNDRIERPAVDHGTAAEGSRVSQVSFVDGSLTENADTAVRTRSSLGDNNTKEGGSKKLHNYHKNWWFKLPYVLGIYLQRTSGRENYRGLYTLKINSCPDGGSSSVTIVFEDRGDAINLCYILESYFEDLNGVRADIVPITTQELMGAVEEKSLNPVVIKKGQLRLYAGQLLSEVERQLEFIVDQSLQQEMQKE